MKTLRFVSPGQACPLDKLLVWAWPDSSPPQRRRALAEGRVVVGGRVWRDGSKRVLPGNLLTVDADKGVAPRYGEVLLLEQREDSVLVRKPAGLACHSPDGRGEDALSLLKMSLGMEELWPVHRLDSAVGGVWLVATTHEAAARLGACFEQRKVGKHYLAVTPSPAWPEGSLTGRIDGKSARTDWAVEENRGGISRLRVSIHTGRTHQIRRHLAQMETPIIGDMLYGGTAVPGGLRLWSHGLEIPSDGVDITCPPPDDFWPPPWVRPALEQDPDPLVAVSESTLEALDRGHPWVLTDTETSDVSGWNPGTRVALQSPQRRWEGRARIEGAGRIAARVWSRSGTGRSVEERVERALARREDLLGDEATTAFRLIHGVADSMPGLHVDRLGSALRLLVRGRCALPLVESVAQALQRLLPGIERVVRVTHLAPCPPGELRCVEEIGQAPAPELEPGRTVVLERGLRFGVDLGLKYPTRPRPGVGLFLDQRRNRQRLSERVSGGTWLNLFAHTGAFSVALLASGAKQVHSVDLSGPYLKWLDSNLELNGMGSAPHQGHRKDVRRFLQRFEGTVEGIVLDPPTAAAAGRKFWSVQRGGAELIAAALGLLQPGGTLLLCRNDARARGSLEPLLRSVARDVGVSLASVDEAGPGEDFPIVDGFPEGDAFAGVLATRGP